METYNLCFFFERGESMANEAINHVVEVERTIAKIRQDAKEKMNELNNIKNEQLDKIEQELQNEIQAFKKMKKQALENQLARNVADNKQSIQTIAEEYNNNYAAKKEELSDYIVKEVLSRYGS